MNGGGCCLYDPAHYATWLGQYLGPTIKKDHPNVSILVFDYNKASFACLIVPRQRICGIAITCLSFRLRCVDNYLSQGGDFIPIMQAISESPAALKYSDGIAVHW